ncbi:hypothetical protein RSAG8_02547, partial [Rhizoctonia solani AG-8 WAC10335]
MVFGPAGILRLEELVNRSTRQLRVRVSSCATNCLRPGVLYEPETFGLTLTKYPPSLPHLFTDSSGTLFTHPSWSYLTTMAERMPLAYPNLGTSQINFSLPLRLAHHRAPRDCNYKARHGFAQVPFPLPHHLWRHLWLSSRSLLRS